MKRLTVFFAALLLSAPAFGALSGYQIAYRVKHSNTAKTSAGHALVRLFNGINATTPSETRKTIILSRRFGSVDNRKSAIRFTDRRSSYRGTTFLSIEQAGGDTLYYIRLKSLGRARRLSSSEKQNNFVDTDFTNESLGGLKLAEYTFKRISDLSRGGKKLYRVWGYKKDRSAKYPKYLAIVNPDTFVAERVMIYDRSGRLAKVVTSSDVRRVEGQGRSYWVPFRVVVQDRIANHKTEILIKEVRLDGFISAARFTPANMSRVWPEQSRFQ